MDFTVAIELKAPIPFIYIATHNQSIRLSYYSNLVHLVVDLSKIFMYFVRYDSDTSISFITNFYRLETRRRQYNIEMLLADMVLLAVHRTTN